MSDGTMKAGGASPTSANGASTDRLEEIVMQAHRDYASGLNPRRGLTETIVDALRAAGATVSPEGTRGGEAALPEPPKGPVTGEEAVRAFADGANAARLPGDEGEWLATDWPEYERESHEVRHGLDAAMLLLARDHGYVKAGSDGLLTREEALREVADMVSVGECGGLDVFSIGDGPYLWGFVKGRLGLNEAQRLADAVRNRLRYLAALTVSHANTRREW